MNSFLYAVCSLSASDAVREFLFLYKVHPMEKRIGIIGIVIEDIECTERINAVLHEHANLIVGRMGIPYKERGVSVVSLIVDGSNDDISALTGQLGRISGASVKSMVTKDSRH